LILQASGPKSFCAGEDLQETLAPVTGSTAELARSLHLLQDITRLTVMRTDLLVISAVQGWAVGGGAEIALAADFVIGGRGAKFKFPEVGLGHAATGGITGRLVSIVGLLRAKELLLTGRTVDAEEALKMGLLTELVEEGVDSRDRALELGRELAGLPRVSAERSKKSIEGFTFPKMEECLEEEVRVAKECFATAEAGRAFEDFAERRKRRGAGDDGKAITAPAVSGTQPAIGNRAVEADIPSITAPKDLNTALAVAVKFHPNKTFLRFTATGQAISYADFSTSVSALAGAFNHIGIRPSDRILVMMRNSLEAVQTWFAANRLGTIWVPINTELRSLALKSVVAAAGAKLAVVDEDLRDAVLETGHFKPEDVFVKDSPSSTTGQKFSSLFTLAPPITNAPFPIKSSSISALLYTSGTTGPSKPCALSHFYFLHSARNLITHLPLLPSDILFSPFPLFHADATNFTVVPALLMGTTAALSPRFSASRFWDEIRETKGTVFSFMGATLTMLFKNVEKASDRHHNVRVAWGVPVPAWAEDYERRFGHRLVELYGSVETGLPIIQSGERVPGSCGKAVEEYELRIADEEDEALPVNTPGHLLVRCQRPNALFEGYFNDPMATVATYKNTWLHTGDIAQVDEEGNVFFVGRKKDVIRRRGENISAFNVEEEIQAHPEVKLCAAIAVPSSLGTDKSAEDDIKVMVEVRGGAEERGFSEEALWKWCQGRMTRFMVPGVVEFVEEGALEKTETGKVVKRALKAEGGKRFDDKR
jgi:acyl-CoA synthetase (AMP-forming)/AMP-acid ligase II/enoyl-CoA hydratase/carnithine racemase